MYWQTKAVLLSKIQLFRWLIIFLGCGAPYSYKLRLKHGNNDVTDPRDQVHTGKGGGENE